MAKSKNKRKHHNEPAAPVHRPAAKGPPTVLVAMLAGGFALVIALVALSNRERPATAPPPAPVDSAANRTGDAAKAPPPPSRNTADARGAGPHTLVASLPADAGAFGGNAEQARTFAQLKADSADFSKARVTLTSAQKLQGEVGSGPGASEVAVLTAMLQLMTRDAAAATSTLNTALAADPGDQRDTLETLALQAQVDGLAKGQAPSEELVGKLRAKAEDVDDPMIKAAATFHLARALKRAGKQEEAVTTFQRVADTWPTATEAASAWFELGTYYRDQKRSEDALVAFDALIKGYPASAQAKKAREYAGQLRVIGKPGVDVKAAEWINNDPGKLAAEMKGKVVLYLFFASWCPHCRNEMPEIVRMYDQYKAQGLEIVAVTSVDSRQTRDQITSYLKEADVRFPVALQDGREASQYYAIGGIPAAAVVDRSGIVRWRDHPGQGVESEIKQLLAEPGPS